MTAHSICFLTRHFKDSTEMVALIPSAQAKIEYICQNYDLEDFSIEMISALSQSDYLKRVLTLIMLYIHNGRTERHML